MKTDEDEEEDEGWSAMVVMCKSNLQPLLEEGKRNGARRISGGILGTIPLHFLSNSENELPSDNLFSLGPSVMITFFRSFLSLQV